MIENEFFVPLISQLAINENITSNCSYFILNLYVRILKSNEDDLPMLKPTVSEILVCANKIIDHFFCLFEVINST